MSYRLVAIVVAALATGCVDLELESLCTRDPGNAECVEDAGGDSGSLGQETSADTADSGFDSESPDTESNDSTMDSASDSTSSDSGAPDTTTVDSTVTETAVVMTDTSSADTSPPPDTTPVDTAMPDTAVCAPGDYTCAGSTLKKCNAARTGYDDVIACPAGTCSAALGRCAFCTPGAARCTGAKLERCDSLGASWTTASTCATPELCSASGSGSCVPPACATGELRCNGKAREQCNAGRTGFSAIETCTLTCAGGGTVCLAVSRIAAGRVHACAIASTDEVYCWGSNTDGQLGTGGGSTNIPTKVPAISGAQSIAANMAHTCVTLTGGAIKCWGANESGQLGDGTKTKATTPVTVAGFAGTAISVSAGQNFTCALPLSGTVKCWGAGVVGELGDGMSADSLVPVDTGFTASEIVSGDSFSCGLGAGGTVKCWGANGQGQIGNGGTTPQPTPSTVLTGASEIFTGRQHACALKSSGELLCWGTNYRGALALDFATPMSKTPISVIASGVGRVALGGYTSCVTISGTVKCWGENDYAQVDPSLTDRSTPTATMTYSGSPFIAFGREFGFIFAGTDIKGWGRNLEGQLGIGSTSSPVSTATPIAWP